MEMDLVNFNKMRELNGLPALDKLPDEITGKKSDPPPSTKTPEEIEAERLKAEQEDKNIPPVAGDDVDDEKLLAYLAKRGIKASSLDDLKPKDPDEDPALAAEKLENDKISFGLSKGMFNRKTYDNFVIDSREPRNLVFAEYHSEAKKDDPNLTDEEIQAEFNEEYGLDADPTSRKYRRGQKDLKVRAENLLNQKYSKIISLDSEFNSHQQARQIESDRRKNILAKTPQYKKDVETVFEGLKKITTKYSDTESYEVALLDEAINEFKDNFLSPEVAEKMIEDGYTPDKLKEIAFTGVLYKHFPFISKEISKQYALSVQKGAKGIPNETDQRDKSENGIVLTENQKRYRAEAEKNKPIPATN